MPEAYEYWCDRIRADGCVWGIVKTDHESKLGNYQQLSYQMVNTLPCSKKDVKAIAQDSIDYVELIKSDNREFEKFLRKNANEINHYEMLADLYAHNNDFANSTWFREEKRKIISNYVYRLRKGKIFVEGDNLTVFGNPYALLLYSVGEDWKDDPTFQKEDGCIQCYTPRFSSNEYLAAFRNPHNSPNNVCYMHNVYSKYFERYFEFSKNIMAVNCIETDVQDRCNGEDFDSDFNLVTNHPTIVGCAKKCYQEYPTIVNSLQESGMTYGNSKTDYSNMDNKFSGSQMGIGWSSNLAQLAMTYYWSELSKEYPDEDRLKELYDNFVILSVLAQVIIDGCKRVYEIDGEDEIKRISQLPCMSLTKTIEYDDGKFKTIKCDFPEFMRYTREIPHTKDGKELPYETVSKNKNKLRYTLDRGSISSGVSISFKKVSASGTPSTVRIIPLISAVSIAVCTVLWTVSSSFAPTALATATPPPKLRPTNRLTIRLDIAPVAPTAATELLPQYLPTTIRSAALKHICKSEPSMMGMANFIILLRMGP